MKRNFFLQLIIFCFLALATFPVQATIAEPQAREWVEDKGNLLLAAFGEEKLLNKYQKLDELFLEYVDLDSIGKFVIGKFWRQMTPEQQERYSSLFKRYALAVYKGFPLNFKNRVDFEVTKISQNKNNTGVMTAIHLKPEKGEQPAVGVQNNTIMVEFLLTEKNGKIQIVDIKIAESSLILSYRSRFYQMVANSDDDLEWFLEDLQDITVSTEKTNLLSLKKAGY